MAQSSIEPLPTRSNISVKVRPTPPSQRFKPTYPKPRRRRSLLFKGLVWGTTFSVTACLSGLLGVGAALFTPLDLPFLPPSVTQAPTKETLLAGNNWKALFPYRLARPVNILVMGIDRVEDAPPDSLAAFDGRSDTLLLLRFDPTDNTLKLLSIPRDTRVEISQHGYNKINDANALGGPALAAQVVSQTLHEVTIDRYLRVTTNAFRELVDLVGGVEVYVPKPMVYSDKTQKLEINLAEGLQVLNGDQAEQFARFRHDANGDIGRVQRQEILLKALQKRLNNPTLITQIPQAIQILRQSIDTNLTMEEFLALANFGRQLDKQQVQMVMLPGRFSQKEEFDGRSYWVMNRRGRDRVMEQYFDIQLDSAVASPSPETPNELERLTIALQNATDDPQLLDSFRQYLRQQNFRNVYTTEDSPQLLGETEIVAQQGDLKAAKDLKGFLGIGQVEASSTGDLASEITIRLGTDIATFLEKQQNFSTDPALSTSPFSPTAQ
jgi:LCP family protein required for cell wall assembly